MSDDEQEVIDISDSDGSNEDPNDLFGPLVRRVVSALGGGTPYKPGDSAYACLKDLKRLWRKDDDTVARLLWDARTMSNDLIPLLLMLTPEDKRAVATMDLITAMTWPVDVAAELKDLAENDEDADARPEYSNLLAAHAAYKTALCAPNVMDAIFRILLPPLAKPIKERSARDGQIINVILHFYRNLAFIRTDSSTYILRLCATHASDLLLTIAANESRDPLFNSFNTVVLETLYLLTRFVPPVVTSSTKPSLRNLLQADAELKKKPAPSRHSRFGTTIQVTLKNKQGPSNKPFVLHRAQAIDPKTSATALWDLSKKAKARPPREVLIQDNLTPAADEALRGIMSSFIDGAFNPFIVDIIKDIRAERPKINQGDHLRLLCFSSWALEFFLSRETRELGLVAEVTERTWVSWVLRRIREALDDKPKRLGEVKAGVGSLTQLILVIEQLEERETFVRQLVYNGETLDITFDALKLRVDGSIRMAYELLRVLEGSDKMIRRKKGGEGEINWSFEAFESKFATPEITSVLLLHLATIPTPLKYVLSLMHRQVVKLKGEGLYFNVSTLLLFQRLLRELPKEKDLIKFINYVLRQFFKHLENDSFLAVEAFFPRTRGGWKKFGKDGEDEPKGKGKGKKRSKTVMEKELHVKDGHDWREQVGIALKALVALYPELAEWIKEILSLAVAHQGGDPEHDFCVPILTEDKGDAVTNNAHLKLVLRLCGFRVEEISAIDDELSWIFPKDRDVQKHYDTICEFLETPIDIEEELVTRTTRRRRKITESSSESSDDNDMDASGSDGGVKKKKKSRRKRDDGESIEKRKRKEKEKENYKSAQFIEDSDEEYGDMEMFLQKEAERRAGRKKPVNMYEERPEGMRLQGTKKRKKKADGDGAQSKKKRKSDRAQAESDSDAHEDEVMAEVTPERPRPRPKPLIKANATQVVSDGEPKVVQPRRAKKLIVTDDDD